MKPKKSLGQNFIKDQNLLSKIVESGKITSEDTILEIGPGTGNLTNELIKKSKGTVTCFISLIELDFLNGRTKIDTPIASLIHY